MYNVVKFKNKNGKCPLDAFLKDLLSSGDKLSINRVEHFINLLRQFGYELPKIFPKYVKHLEENLYELRPGNKRIIYFFHRKDEQEGYYVLLHGFIKKAQKTPEKEIELAKKEMKEYEGMN